MMNMIMLLVVMIILKYDYHYHLCRILFIHQYYSSLRFIIITTVIILGAVIKDNHYTLVSIHRYLSSFCNWLNIEQYHHLLLVWYLLQRTLLADSRTYKKQHLAAVHPYFCDFSVVLACVFFVPNISPHTRKHAGHQPKTTDLPIITFQSCQVFIKKSVPPIWFRRLVFFFAQ